jgi:hypothetical protein
MRKIVLALAAVAAFGLALPLVPGAKAEEARVVVKTGERHHHWNRGHRKVVIIKKRHRDYGLHRGWRRHHTESRVIVR